MERSEPSLATRFVMASFLLVFMLVSHVKIHVPLHKLLQALVQIGFRRVAEVLHAQGAAPRQYHSSPQKHKGINATVRESSPLWHA